MKQESPCEAMGSVKNNNETLLDMAINNYNSANAIYKYAFCGSRNDSLLNMVAYHLQQAVELAINIY